MYFRPFIGVLTKCPFKKRSIRGWILYHHPSWLMESRCFLYLNHQYGSYLGNKHIPPNGMPAYPTWGKPECRRKKRGRCDRSHSGHVDVDLKILENSGWNKGVFVSFTTEMSWVSFAGSLLTMSPPKPSFVDNMGSLPKHSNGALICRVRKVPVAWFVTVLQLLQGLGSPQKKWQYNVIYTWQMAWWEQKSYHRKLMAFTL